jgi:hypothetical protein
VLEANQLLQPVVVGFGGADRIQRSEINELLGVLCHTRFGLAPSGGIHMQFERGKAPETPNAPYRAARVMNERWRSAGPGFELGWAGSRLTLRSSQDQPGSQDAALLNFGTRSHCIESCLKHLFQMTVHWQPRLVSSVSGLVPCCALFFESVLPS